MRIFLVLPIGLALTGCQLTRSQELQADADLCRSYGFRDGSQEMANCRMQRDQQRSAALQGYLDRQPRQQPIQVVQPRPSVSCTSVNNGGIVSTNCN